MSSASVVIVKTGDSQFAIEGSLVHETVGQLWDNREKVCWSQQATEVNLSKLKLIDSAGIAFLVALHNCHMNNGHPLRFTELPEQLVSMVKISGLTDILPAEIND